MGSLALMCAMAFAAVFTLLTVLSILMTALTAAFPPKKIAAAVGTDAATKAAITATMNQIYPGARVSKIEEKR